MKKSNRVPPREDRHSDNMADAQAAPIAADASHRTAGRGRGLSEMSTDSAEVAASYTSGLSSMSMSSVKQRFRLGGRLGRRALGLFCLMVTVCLWTVSNFLASVGTALLARCFFLLLQYVL